MLEYTFQHIVGLGNIRERELWEKNILSWNDYEKRTSIQLSLDLYGSKNLLSESKTKIEHRDGRYFAERLSSQLHYRIAHTFPEKTIFLDIETTGLSRYYNRITIVGWSVLNKFKVHINGDEETKIELLHDIAKADCIVTFNGSLFDIPFLKSTFPEIQIPPCHIDLRFFSRRVGLQGGQKLIEELLNFKRPSDLIEVNGFEATLLWHHYKEGDLECLKKLIKYNAFDIQGMKYIFEKVTNMLIKKENLPFKKQLIFPFSQYKTSLKFDSLRSPDKIYLKKYTGKVGPKIYLNELPDLSSHRIIGIDLTGSETKASGWAIMENGIARTMMILSDDEIIEQTIKLKPTIISIDSPLSLPIGRISVFDDDPGRQEFGITRFCERTMAKRGVKSYPCLIQSMQRLTQRGIKLANRFRNLGYAVIESYPGAAQDILGIPRKKKSLEYLVKGLQQFGIKGEYDKTGVAHDEIDAITSALVGYFFLANKFEGLGNEDEDYLIIPKLEDTDMPTKIVIGLSGQLSSGKTTSGKILQERGFHYSRYSMVINNMLEKQGSPLTRTHQQKLGNNIHQEKGQRWLGNELMKLLPPDKNLVIDGLRFLEDHSFLREKFGVNYFHIHLTSDLVNRLERYKLSERNDRPFEQADMDTVEHNIENLKDFADIVISNNNSIAELKIELIQTVDNLCQYQL